MSRKRFQQFRPRPLAALSAALALVGCRGAAPLPTVSRASEVMGTVFSVAAWGPDSLRLEHAVAQAFDSVRLVDSLLSTEHPGSEIGRVHRAGGGTSLSPTFRAVLGTALQVARRSHGAFDPTRGDWRGVRFDSGAGGARLALRRGLRLDLAGIAQGYALDRAVLGVASAADSAVLTMGGQYLIFTTARDSASRPGRAVGVVDPSNTLQTIALITVPAGTWAVSTTSLVERPAHLVDPRTGRRATRVRAATTVGPNAATAMAWSAAFFVLGCDSALALVPQLDGMEVLCADQRVRWSAGLDGRVTTTDSVAAGTARGPAPGRAPAPAGAPNGSTSPPSSLDSSR